MYYPTRKFQMYLIFAANTNLGKTIFSTGLCRAAALRFRRLDNKVKFNLQSLNKTYYLKPIQTGYPESSDSNFVRNFVDKDMNVSTKTLYAYEKPLSPHLAVDKDKVNL